MHRSEPLCDAGEEAGDARSRLLLVVLAVGPGEGRLHRGTARGHHGRGGLDGPQGGLVDDFLDGRRGRAKLPGVAGRPPTMQLRSLLALQEDVALLGGGDGRARSGRRVQPRREGSRPGLWHRRAVEVALRQRRLMLPLPVVVGAAQEARAQEEKNLQSVRAGLRPHYNIAEFDIFCHCFLHYYEMY